MPGSDDLFTNWNKENSNTQVPPCMSAALWCCQICKFKNKHEKNKQKQINKRKQTKENKQDYHGDANEITAFWA